MDFEIRGVRVATGKRVVVRVRASSLERAIDLATKVGITVDPPTSTSPKNVGCPQDRSLTEEPHSASPSQLPTHLSHALSNKSLRQSRKALTIWISTSVIGVALASAILVVVTHNRDKHAGDVAALANAIASSQQWLDNGTASDVENVKRTLTNAILRVNISRISNSNAKLGEQLLEQIAAKENALKADELFDIAKRQLAQGQVTEAAESLHKYCNSSLGSMQQGAKTLIREIEQATSLTFARDVLCRMTDSEFADFLKNRRFASAVITEPALADVLLRSMEKELAPEQARREEIARRRAEENAAAARRRAEENAAAARRRAEEIAIADSKARAEQVANLNLSGAWADLTQVASGRVYRGHLPSDVERSVAVGNLLEIQKSGTKAQKQAASEFINRFGNERVAELHKSLTPGAQRAAQVKTIFRMLQDPGSTNRSLFASWLDLAQLATEDAKARHASATEKQRLLEMWIREVLPFIRSAARAKNQSTHINLAYGALRQEVWLRISNPTKSEITNIAILLHVKQNNTHDFDHLVFLPRMLPGETIMPEYLRGWLYAGPGREKQITAQTAITFDVWCDQGHSESVAGDAIDGYDIRDAFMENMIAAGAKYATVTETRPRILEFGGTQGVNSRRRITAVMKELSADGTKSNERTFSGPKPTERRDESLSFHPARLDFEISAPFRQRRQGMLIGLDDIRDMPMQLTWMEGRLLHTHPLGGQVVYVPVE